MSKQGKSGVFAPYTDEVHRMTIAKDESLRVSRLFIVVVGVFLTFIVPFLSYLISRNFFIGLMISLIGETGDSTVFGIYIAQNWLAVVLGNIASAFMSLLELAVMGVYTYRFSKGISMAEFFNGNELLAARFNTLRKSVIIASFLFNACGSIFIAWQNNKVEAVDYTQVPQVAAYQQQINAKQQDILDLEQDKRTENTKTFLINCDTGRGCEKTEDGLLTIPKWRQDVKDLQTARNEYIQLIMRTEDNQKGNSLVNSILQGFLLILATVFIYGAYTQGLPVVSSLRGDMTKKVEAERARLVPNLTKSNNGFGNTAQRSSSLAKPASSQANKPPGMGSNFGKSEL